MNERDPSQALTGSVEDALRLGCVAIGFTIYPGSEHRFEMYANSGPGGKGETKRPRRRRVVVSSWLRSEQAGRTAFNVCAYAAHIAAQLAHTSSR